MATVGFLANTPIWDNRFYSELGKLPNGSVWISAGVKVFSAIMMG